MLQKEPFGRQFEIEDNIQLIDVRNITRAEIAAVNIRPANNPAEIQCKTINEIDKLSFLCFMAGIIFITKFAYQGLA
ncbi:MAG: hypothetical protein HKN08_09635 [Gammaproteobacteria bacterium]|nr:hypothetical protein [Gammaproteobacteria bacterium]